MKHKDVKNKINLKTIIISIVVIFFVYITIVGISLYIFGAHNSVVNKTAKSLHFPVAIIGMNNFVTINQLEDNLTSVRKFYEGQNFSGIGFRVDFKTEDGQKRLKIKEKGLLNKLIENKIIEKLASSHDIIITEAMVSQSVDMEIAQLNNIENVSQNIASLYGWDMHDFENKIVKPDMYREKLEKYMREQDVDFTKANSKIIQAQDELNQGADFMNIAKKYSEGESAVVGGDLGWFTADQMMPEISIPAFVMQKGDRSDVIESSIGFHIIRIDDKQSMDGKDKVKISQIIVRKKDFAGWLLEEEKNISIFIPLKEYRWNKETGTVDFVDQEMKDFEDNLMINSAGDISVIF